MANLATFDGYSDQYTIDSERVLVTLLRGLGPWKDSVFLVGGLTPPRRETANKENRVLPRTQPAQQCHQHAFRVDRVLVAVAVEGRKVGHQNPILSLRRCSAISLARPSPRSKSR